MVCEFVQTAIDETGEEGLEQLRSMMNRNMISISQDNNLVAALFSLIQSGYDGQLAEDPGLSIILGNAIDFLFTNVVMGAYDRQKIASKYQEHFEKEL